MVGSGEEAPVGLVKVVVYVVCLALVAHELVGLLVHSPVQLDTWLVARCVKREWERWESGRELVANGASCWC
jgi:hypothetical protein